MKINGIDLNSIFAAREGRNIDLYGSYYNPKTNTIVVIRGTKNMHWLDFQAFGEVLSQNLIITKMRNRPNDNVIYSLADCPKYFNSKHIPMDHVRFVD